MSTPHNQAEFGEIAKTVLMPGDPLRAKFLAETYLEDVKQFNAVRNMLGYTGTYHGKKVSIMGSGMGQPSIGILFLDSLSNRSRSLFVLVLWLFSKSVHLEILLLYKVLGTDSRFALSMKLPGTYSAISSMTYLKSSHET